MKITGRVEVLVNGNPLLNKPGAVASGIGISGQAAMEREAVLGDTGLHGFVEKPVPAMLEVTLTDREDVSLSELASLFENATVIFRGANGGKSYTMEGATCLENFSITGGEGETPVKFVGAYWTESKQ